MTPALTLSRELDALTQEVKSHREDIFFLQAARAVNPQAADRATEVRLARILQLEEAIQALRLEALRMSTDR
jgi:hypothetical protein